MRRWIVSVLACLCFVLAITPRIALADGEGWTYNPSAQTLTNGSVTLESVTADGTNLAIGIQPAFSPLWEVQEIDLTGPITDANDTSYSITSIGDSSFQFCQKLVSFKMPDSVEVIGESAFQQCTSLKSINISSSVKTIGNFAFSHCSALNSVEIPNTVESIGWEAFSNCSSLTSINIPSSVTNIDRYAFYGCSSLNSVEVPSSVDTIGKCAFSNCSNLENLSLGYGIKDIGDSAFSGCDSLTSVEIPGTVKNIGDSAFYSCNSLNTLTLNDGIETIGNSAFYGCSPLTSLEIPESVTSIGSKAFYHCGFLSRVTVFATLVPNLGSDAFDYTEPNLVLVVPANYFKKYDLGWEEYSDQLRPGYTLTVAGEPVGTLYVEGDKINLPDVADKDACHPFAGWKVESGEGSFRGNTFTMGNSNTALVASYGENHVWDDEGHCTVCGAINPDFSPHITSGDGATWRTDEVKGLTFVSDAAYTDFERVLVDEEEVDPASYEVQEGSTVVTLGTTYLGTLSEGSHTISIVSATGTAKATFTVLSADNTGNSDETDSGDTTLNNGPVSGGGTTVNDEANINSDTGSNGAASNNSEGLAATGDHLLSSAVVAAVVVLGAVLVVIGMFVPKMHRG